eukprot:Gb_37954 [translate_table: standard]
MAVLSSCGALSWKDCIDFPSSCSQLHELSARGLSMLKNVLKENKKGHWSGSCNAGRNVEISKSCLLSNNFGTMFSGNTGGTRFGTRFSKVAKCSGGSEYSSVGLQKLDFDIVIVGAGIIGLTIARQFLLNTNFSIAIIDAQRPCAGATGAGQGYIWLGYRTPGNDKWELETRSKQLWEQLVQEVESSGLEPLEVLGWKKTGSLLVGTTLEESVALQERVKLLSKAGVRAEYLSASSLHQVEPALNVGKEGGAALVPDDGQIDAKLSVSFIEENNRAFTSQGRYREFFQEPAIRLIRSGQNGHIEGVQTSKHVLYGHAAIVVAAGAWSGSLIEKLAEESGFPLNVPVKPRKFFPCVVVVAA